MTQMSFFFTCNGPGFAVLVSYKRSNNDLQAGHLSLRLPDKRGAKYNPSNHKTNICRTCGGHESSGSSPLPLRLQVKVTRTRSLTLGDGSHFVPSLENCNSWLIHRVWAIDNKNYFCPRLLLPNQSVHCDPWHQKEGIYLQQVFQCSYLETRSGRFFTGLINNENKSLVAALISVLEI